MADRVSVSITIGGTLAPADLAKFVNTVIGEGLSVEWDGPGFDAAQIPDGWPLNLYAHEVAWGMVEPLEALCVELQLPFVRWSGGYPGAFGPELLVFTGSGAPRSFAADEEERAVICRDTAASLGGIRAIRAHFAAAEFIVPPLQVMGAGGGHGG